MAALAEVLLLSIMRRPGWALPAIKRGNWFRSGHIRSGHAVTIFPTAFSRRPSGPLAPPPRRASPSLRRRHAGRLARGPKLLGPPFTHQSLGFTDAGRRPSSRCGIVQGRAEPVKAFCDRRTSAPWGRLVNAHAKTALTVNLPGQRDGSNRKQGHKWPGEVRQVSVCASVSSCTQYSSRDPNSTS